MAKLIIDPVLKISPYQILDKNEKIYVDLGRFFHYGLERASANFRMHGFEVVDLNMNLCHIDPVIHFKKI